jgi:hypothetical protein
LNTKVLGAGVSLKIRDLPRYEQAPAGILQVEYNLEPSKNTLWYDMSYINCNTMVGPEDPSFCPMLDSGVALDAFQYALGMECPAAKCSNGVCEGTYMKSGSWHNEPTLSCPVGGDLVLTTCTERSGMHTVDHQAQVAKPATQPSTVSPVLSISPSSSCGGSTK